MVELVLIIGLLAFLFMGLEGEGGAGEGQGGASAGGAEVFPGQAACEATLTPEDRLQGVLHDPAISEAYYNARHPLHKMAVKRVEMAFNSTYGTEPAGDFAAEAGVTATDLLAGEEKRKQIEAETEGRKLFKRAKNGPLSEDEVEKAISGGHISALAESAASELRSIGRWTPELQQELDGVVSVVKSQIKAGNKDWVDYARQMTGSIRETIQKGRNLGAYR